jgi:branched-subunit amino acid transport protein
MLLLALGCWVMRSVFVLVVPAERLPARLQQGLAGLAPAVLAALVVAELSDATRGADPLAAVVLVGTIVVAGLAVGLTGSLGLAITLGLVGALVVDVLL